MKQFLFIAIAALTVLSSCQKDPSVSVTPQTATLSTQGGTLNFTVTSDGEWSSTAPAGVIVSPSSGSGNSPVSITVPENTTGSARELKVSFSCQKGSSSQTVTISQEFYEEPLSYKLKYPETVDFAAGEYTLDLQVNHNWTISSTAEGITFSPAAGEAGTHSITVSVPEYTGTSSDKRKFQFTFAAKGISVDYSIPLSIYQTAPNILYGKDTYKIVKLKDGNLWMAENLRFVPEGKTPSSDLTALDNGLWYPTKVNEAGTEQLFDKSTEGISAKGYLYTVETALGIARGAITESNAASFEGAQGICPEGWHLPTVTEMVNLVGKCNNKDLTNPDAPYYDATLASPNGSIPKLEADNWPIADNIAGMIQVNKNTDTAGTLSGAIGTPKSLNTGYFIGSSFYKKTTTNLQFYGLMPARKTGVISAGFLNITHGTSIRCVKKSQAEYMTISIQKI